MICTRLTHSSVRRLALVTAALTLGPAMSACNNAGEGAFSGAAIGTLGGLALGSLSGNAGQGAIVGLVSGAMAGGVIGDQNARYAGVPSGAYHAPAPRGSDRMPASQQPVDYFDPYTPANMRAYGATNAPREPHQDHQPTQQWTDESHVDVDALIERHRREIERLEALRRELEARDAAAADGVWHAGAEQAQQLEAQRHYGQDTAIQPLNQYQTQQAANQYTNIYANNVFYPTHYSGAHTCTSYCGCVYCNSCRTYHTRAEYFSRCATGVTVSYRWRAPLWRTSLYYGWRPTTYDWRFRYGYGLSWSSRYGVRPFGTIGWWYDSYDSRYCSPYWRPGSYWHAGAWWYGASFYYVHRPWWYSTHHDRHRSAIAASRTFTPTAPRIVEPKRNPTRDRFLAARDRDESSNRAFASRGAPTSRETFDAQRRAREAEEAHRDRRTAQRPQAGDDAANTRPGDNWVSRRESLADADQGRRELRRIPDAQDDARPASPPTQTPQSRPDAAAGSDGARRPMRPADSPDASPTPPPQRPEASPPPQSRRPGAEPEHQPAPTARPAPPPQRPEASPPPQSRRPAAQPAPPPAPTARPAPPPQQPQAQPQRSRRAPAASTPQRPSRPAARPQQRSDRVGDQRANNNSRRGRGG